MQVIVADDEIKVRSALELLLEQELGLSVTVEAMDMDELLCQPASSDFELLLLDWELPGLTPADLETLRSHHSHLQIIALSGRPDARPAALVAGVDAFVSKVASPDLLLTTIRGLLMSSTNGSSRRAKSKAYAGRDGASGSTTPADADVAGGKR
jgi:DNA-binding NarL/FixJ family response regulator